MWDREVTRDDEMGSVVNAHANGDFIILVYDNNLSPWRHNVEVWQEGSLIFERMGFSTVGNAVDRAYTFIREENK